MANFPTNVSTNSNLYVAVNGLQTTLAANILSTDTTIQLTSTTGFPTTGFVTIENNEVVSYTGISGPNLTGCTRGADGTTALAHNTGVTVGATIVAAHHNLLKDEVIAIETSLGAGYLQASANTANAVVQRDGSGNFSAGTITASLTGAASSNLLKAGDTMTGDLTMSNQKGIILKELTANGTDSTKIEAADDVTTSYTLKLPPAVASAGQVLTDAAGDGVLSWSTTGTGTVTNVSGTTNQVTVTNPTTTPVISLPSQVTLSGSDPKLILDNTTSADLPYIEGGKGGDGYLHASGGTNRGVKLDYNSGGSTILTADSNGVDVNSHKILNVTNGSAASDAAAFGQIPVFATAVQATTTTSTSVTSSTFTSTALTASITPTSSSRRIKITLSGTWTLLDMTRNYYLTIERGTTNLAGTSGFLLGSNASTVTGSLNFPVALVYIDSPSTTSSTTYTVYIRNDNNVATVLFPGGQGSSTGVMVLEEII